MSTKDLNKHSHGLLTEAKNSCCQEPINQKKTHKLFYPEIIPRVLISSKIKATTDIFRVSINFKILYWI